MAAHGLALIFCLSSTGKLLPICPVIPITAYIDVYSLRSVRPQDLYGALAYHNAGRHGVAGDPQDIKRRPLGIRRNDDVSDLSVASQADRFGPEPSLSHHFECNCEDEDGT